MTDGDTEASGAERATGTGHGSDDAHASMAADHGSAGLWFITYLHVHGWRGRRWSPPPPRFESMPRAQWRSLAAICFAIGAVGGAVLGREDPVLAVAAAIVVGLIAVAVGMWVIETLWLRSRRPSVGSPPPAPECATAPGSATLSPYGGVP